MTLVTRVDALARVSVGSKRTSRSVYTRWNYAGYEIRFGIQEVSRTI